MKYILAALACGAVFIACVLVAVLLEGGEENEYIRYACAGAGLAAISLTWRKITKTKATSKSQETNSLNSAETLNSNLNEEDV